MLTKHFFFPFLHFYCVLPLETVCIADSVLKKQSIFLRKYRKSPNHTGHFQNEYCNAKNIKIRNRQKRLRHTNARGYKQKVQKCIQRNVQIKRQTPIILKEMITVTSLLYICFGLNIMEACFCHRKKMSACLIMYLTF